MITIRWRRRLGLATVGALMLAGCTSGDYGNKQMAGALVGAAGGGLLGSQLEGGRKTQLAATAAGTLLGAFLGSEAGKSLDRADRVAANGAATGYQPSASAASWPPGTSGWVDPDRVAAPAAGPTPVAAAGRCRDIQYDATVGGRTERVYGTACQTADGQWRLVN